jgi:glucose-6-phosphate dehydrogenase assembly protein OpcA
MAPREGYRSVLSGEARQVDVPAIEHELTQLWKAAAEGTLEGQPVMRACVLNLVAYAPSPRAADHITEVISQACGRHPSRSIIMVAGRGARSPRLRASIAAHCQIAPEGGKQVCSEQITLRASGAALDELHGTVLPLLVPDLPVFLWWHDEPPLTGHLFRELLETCDRLVVDSAGLEPERATRFLRGLQGLVEEGQIAVSDLNWSRLTHWRRLVAQFFDAAPGRQYLDGLERLEVGIASRRGRRSDVAEGLLMVGWLASRLGWALEDGRSSRGGAMVFRFRGSSGPVAVEIKLESSRRGEGLRSIRLEAAGGAAFAVARVPDDETCVAVTSETPGGGHSRVVRMVVHSEADLLCDEMETQGRDTIFEEALAQAVRLTDATR